MGRYLFILDESRHYLIHSVEGRTQVREYSLLVVRSVEKNREGLSQSPHVRTDEQALVAGLAEYLQRAEIKEKQAA